MSLPQVLREYGQAFRGDWSPETIDGRSVRSEMEEIARWIEIGYPGDVAARQRLGICPGGLGHWEWPYCDGDCPPTPTTDPAAAATRAELTAEQED